MDQQHPFNLATRHPDTRAGAAGLPGAGGTPAATVLSEGEWLAVSTEGFSEQQRGRPLEHLVKELVQNAMDSVGDSGHIDLDIRPAGPRRAVIRCADDGPGAEDLSRLNVVFVTGKKDGVTQRGRMGRGLIGVVIFSGSLPATRVAVSDYPPLFLTSARAVIAALLGAAFLALLRQAKPTRGDLASLVVVALGVVIGFPLLTALALQHITSAHSIVFIGLLPLATATFGVLRGGERPKPAFWLFSGLGGAAVAGFALQGGGGSLAGDLLMVLAILLCGLGYAEGATLSRRLGGWQVISWALLLSLPLMATVALVTMPGSWNGISGSGWPMSLCSACW